MVKQIVLALLAAGLAALLVLWLVIWRTGSDGGSVSDGAVAPPPISGAVANFTPTVPSRPAPIVEFYDTDGRDVSLLDFSGKIVLLNLWATWCAPCVKEMPSLDRLQAKLGTADFVVIPVSVDRQGAEVVKPFFTKLGIANLGIYVDPKNVLGAELGLTVLPSTIVISRNGTMLGKLIGAVEWDSPEAVALVRYYIDLPRQVSQGGGS
jgi:thiol-disulfide isomerase/thioredoxin